MTRQGATNNWNAALLAKRVSDVHIDTLYELSNYTIPVDYLASSEYWARCYDLLLFTLGYYGSSERADIEEATDDLESLLRLFKLHRRFLIVMMPKNNQIVKVGKALGQSVTVDCFVCMCLNLACQALIDPGLQDEATYDASFPAARHLHMAVHGETVPIARYSQQQLYYSWQVCSENWLSVDMLRDEEALLDLIDYRQALLYRTAEIMIAHFPIERGQEDRTLYMLDMADRSPVSAGTISSYVQWSEEGTGVERSTRWVQEVVSFYATTEMLLAMHVETVLPKVRNVDPQLLLAFFSAGTELGAVGLAEAERFYRDTVRAFERFLVTERAEDIQDATVAKRLSKRIRKHMVPPPYKRIVLFGNGLMGHSDHNQLEKESLPKITRFHLTGALHRFTVCDFVAGDLFPDVPGARDLAIICVFEQEILCANRNMKFGREVVMADYDLWRWLLPTPLTRAEDKHMGGYHASSIGTWEPDRGARFRPDSDDWCLPIRMRDTGSGRANAMPCIVKLCRNYYVYHFGAFYAVSGIAEAILVWSLIIVTVCTGCEYRRAHRGRRDNVVDMGFLRPYLEKMIDHHVQKVPRPVRAVLQSRIPPRPGDVQDMGRTQVSAEQRKLISELFASTRELS